MKMHSREDIVAFGGIQDPTVMAPRSSDRVRAQPNADATQLERAVLLANKKNALDMSDTKSKSKSMLSILSLSDDEIISRASKLGVSLGSSDTDRKKSANIIKKLESDRRVILLSNNLNQNTERDKTSAVMTRASLLCEDLVDEMEEPAWECLDRSLIGLGTKRVTRKRKERRLRLRLGGVLE
jgi:hypothetical protein